tara:strand:- start:278 stop:550 length:273 start_codon:yes stop_codon:yes gene_type:complete
MTTRRPRTTKAAKAEEPTQEEYKIPQEELETFFNDPEPTEEEPKEIPTKRVHPARSNMVFIGEEDMRNFEAYKKFLREEKGLKDVRHKKI